MSQRDDPAGAVLDARDTQTILVVDDDPIGCALIRTLLEGKGYNLGFAQTGVEAFEQALALKPDLILLDVMMRGMNGIETCQRIRADVRLAEIPIIIITALDERAIRLRSIEAGADDFVTKPIDLFELLARVQSILRLNRYKRLVAERSQRQRAEQETTRRNHELSLLNRVIRSAAAQPRTPEDIARIMGEACDALVQVFELPAARAALLDEHGACQISLAAGARGHAPAEVACLALRGSVDAAGTPFVIPAPADDPRLAARRDELAGIAALLIAPVVVQGRGVGGWIELYSFSARPFDERDLSFAQSVASAVGQAIVSVDLHQQLRRHVETLEETVARRTIELRAERDRTADILDALGEAVIVADTNCVVSYVNQAMLDLSGYAAEELLGQNWCAMQPHALALLFKQITAFVQRGQIWRGELLGHRRDGSTYDAMMTVAPLFETGRITGFVSIQRDISPLKAAERLKDEFISNISHELRTPLSVITLHSGNLDTLYEQLNDARRRKLIGAIRVQADVLNALIGDVLEMSRLDTGRAPTAALPVDLEELLSSEAQQQRPLAQRKGQQLSASGAPGLVVAGDERLLRQALRNLINNAIKYTPNGGQISCFCAALQGGPAGGWPGSEQLSEGRWAAVRVADSGIGIAAEHMPKLFERFFRVQNQGGVPGTGLGLAITKEILARHGGLLGVESAPGAGSVFAFYLPLAPA